MGAIICSFSGHVMDVKKRRRESQEDFRRRQFEAFAKDPRASVWDMSEGLYKIVDTWKALGLIEDVPEKSRFPWCWYRLTEKGQAKLANDRIGQ